MNGRWTLFGIAMFVSAAAARAQGAGDSTDARLRAHLPARPGPRVVAGIVVDSAMVPIESVTVSIVSLKDRALSRQDGTFRFDNVKPGTYQVAARKVGYTPQIRDVVVDDRGGVVGLELVPLPQVLAPVISSSTRGGLSGIVGDTAYNVIPGADVWLMSAGARVTTDSSGAFFIEAKPGHYMLRIARAGFSPRLTSVTIPPDSGRQIVVWLLPSRGAAAREAALMDELSERLLRRSPIWSKLLTREDIVRTGKEELADLANIAAGRPIDPSCLAVVDGKEHMPLWLLRASDIETIEVYTTPPPRQVPTSINNNSRMAGRTAIQSDDECRATVYVWLRR